MDEKEQANALKMLQSASSYLGNKLWFGKYEDFVEMDSIHDAQQLIIQATRIILAELIFKDMIQTKE